jgi:hypothetical protein
MKKLSREQFKENDPRAPATMSVSVKPNVDRHWAGHWDQWNREKKLVEKHFPHLGEFGSAETCISCGFKDVAKGKELGLKTSYFLHDVHSYGPCAKGRCDE